MTSPRRGAGSGWQRFVAPSLADVLFVILFLAALALGASLTNIDGDLGRHLLLGGQILDTGSIPQVDVYSYTVSGTEIIPHWWASQTVFAGVERALGFDGIGLLTALLCALPWAIVYRWLVLRETPIGVALVCALLGASASVIHWVARPHAFTWLFVVMFVLLLEDLRTGRRKQVWILIPLAILWANFHAGFTIGILITAIYLAGTLLEKRLIRTGSSDAFVARHLGWILLGVVAGSIVTPGGIDTIVNAFTYLGNDFLVDATIEYQSPDFHNPITWPFLAFLLATVLLRHRWNAVHLLLVVAWTAAALYSMRNIPIYALVMMPVMASSLTLLASSRRIHPPARLRARVESYAALERSLIGGSFAVVMIFLASFVLLESPGSNYEFSASVFPIKAMERFGDDPPGERPFHMFSWGGYLEYCCHPDVLVFIDGQTDIYGEELSREYVAAMSGEPEWRQVFDEHGVDWVLIEPDASLAQVLAESSDWAETYRDSTAVVFVPNSS